MLDLPKMMDDVEARGNRIGVDMRDLCSKAGIHRRTWSRWRSEETSPSFDKWNAVVGMLEQLEFDRETVAA